MLQLRSILNVADNTGAKKVSLIGIPGKGNCLRAYLAEVITIVIKDAVPHGQVKKGEVLPAVIIRTKKEVRRKDGSYIRFDDNACVILTAKDSYDPRGTRIFGPIAKEVKDKGFNKIVSLAEEIY
ncbi:50S ribosomal protein L14 [Candidatus Roizmanbacteria bacterium CG02_land_8_20_14_3_00_36_15]|uniref:Large ribosomal subunit protein uL14 n=2 Tax=Candidatus Roizmaniibacteriota TaxID=1752723 RepID=A0A2M8KLT0_9BACT|nr:MAG: 50S ribosomal protein L14 [Candidatus Roizmanbacteria bacterium CG03_land_8_20_14_0_80_36_21]PIV37890.1 MAG: 50S ribosomal protein L14 [Candidatus Roizmanbacteria bacterium CG02_land_8_20_14_3_00_36_15]PIY69860.1 MAG: 50S ribosomal protein L14 [Candidatus Roizmanbacteria bacterium CG_4_10_14_0_8_um_filter_36_36]PJA53629.1 MAG: 50S ribosomal protein L14 [Candidatus Roizmanbacteria bacterium CG_4_9_14_3_um_filter_36_11]PJC81698.1 MAG: 50S ribosomal protein L14 [Candidatus Roizmanbacteria 